MVSSDVRGISFEWVLVYCVPCVRDLLVSYTHIPRHTPASRLPLLYARVGVNMHDVHMYVWVPCPVHCCQQRHCWPVSLTSTRVVRITCTTAAAHGFCIDAPTYCNRCTLVDMYHYHGTSASRFFHVNQVCWMHKCTHCVCVLVLPHSGRHTHVGACRASAAIGICLGGGGWLVTGMVKGGLDITNDMADGGVEPVGVG